MIHGHIAVAVLIRIGGLVGIEPILGIRIHGGEGAAGGGMPQQTDFLIQGHLAQQAVHTGADILTPILVHVQGAIAVQILEFQPIHFDDFLGAGFQMNLAGGFIGLHDHFVDGIGLVEGSRVGQGGGCRRVEILLFRNGRAKAGQYHDDSHNQGQLFHDPCSFLSEEKDFLPLLVLLCQMIGRSEQEERKQKKGIIRFPFAVCNIRHKSPEIPALC